MPRWRESLQLSPQMLAADPLAGRLYLRPDGTPMLPHEYPSARTAAEKVPVVNQEINIITETGAEISTSVSAAPLPVEGVSAVIVTVDLTDRKRIEQALTAERDQLQALLDNIPDTIYFKDRASRFTRINQAQARFLGLARPEIALGGHRS